MKKILSFITILSVLASALFILTGCSDDSENGSNNNTSNAQQNMIQVPMTVVNECDGVTIHELYLSGAGVDNWGDDILGDQVLPSGSQVSVYFNIDSNNIKWDIKAVDEDGTAVEFRELDLSNVSTSGGKITLKIENGQAFAIAE